jgi:hypothetical protein
MAPILRIGLAFLIKNMKEKKQNPRKKEMIARYAHIAMETPRYDFQIRWRVYSFNFPPYFFRKVKKF